MLKDSKWEKITQGRPLESIVVISVTAVICRVGTPEGGIRNSEEDRRNRGGELCDQPKKQVGNSYMSGNDSKCWQSKSLYRLQT